MVGMKGGHGGNWLILLVVPPAQLQLVSIQGPQPSPGGTEPNSLIQSPSPFSSVFWCVFPFPQLNVFHPCPFHLQLEPTGREEEALISHQQPQADSTALGTKEGNRPLFWGACSPLHTAPCIPLPAPCLFPAFSPHPVQPIPRG